MVCFYCNSWHSSDGPTGAAAKLDGSQKTGVTLQHHYYGSLSVWINVRMQEEGRGGRKGQNSDQLLSPSVVQFDIWSPP